jgi:hypothetical protein
MPSESRPRARAGASPLTPVLAFTGMASFATGTATLSIFFVTESAPYRFSSVQQFALGLLVGVTYTLGALAAGRVRRAFGRRGLHSRGFLALLSFVMAVLVCVPLVTQSDRSVFALLAGYAPITGMFWPLVEAHVSGGRRAAELRSAIGRFNIVWSATLLPSFLCIPPLLEFSPSAVFVALALMHVASVPLLRGFEAEPGEHADEHHAVPAAYPELLRVHRVLHATSYLVMYALSPYLPKLLARIGLTGMGASVVAAIWLLARALTFALLERWHGWHGRWAVAVVGALLVLGGFGTVVLAPYSGAALALVAVALFLFGAGLAALYTAALYYAFEVGGSEGGSSHEALIGLGYSVGPACGLFVCALEQRGVVGEAQRDGALLLVITTICLVGALLAWQRRRAPSAGA